MGFFNFGINKPRQFNHIPIYWDPEKEEREKREREAREKKEDDGEYHVKIQRGSFRKPDDREDLLTRVARNRKEMIKLGFLLLVLVLIGVFIYYNGGQIMSLYFD